MRSQGGRGGRAALGMWLELGQNGLLAVLRRGGVDVVEVKSPFILWKMRRHGSSCRMLWTLLGGLQWAFTGR